MSSCGDLAKPELIKDPTSLEAPSATESSEKSSTKRLIKKMGEPVRTRTKTVKKERTEVKNNHEKPVDAETIGDKHTKVEEPNLEVPVPKNPDDHTKVEDPKLEALPLEKDHEQKCDNPKLKDPANLDVANKKGQQALHRHKPEFVIEPPIKRGVKRHRQIVDNGERRFIRVWEIKKQELAGMRVAREIALKAREYAEGINHISNERFALLTTLPFFWSDLLSPARKIFVEVLSPEKIKIAADAIINTELAVFFPDVPTEIVKMFDDISLDDPHLLEKIEAGLSAATRNMYVKDSLYKKVKSFRQRFVQKKKDHPMNLATNLLLRKIKAAHICYKNWLAEQKPNEPEKSRKHEKLIQKARRWLQPERRKPEIQRPMVINWEAVKRDFDPWIATANFAVVPARLEQIKIFIRYMIKFYANVSDWQKAQWRDALVAVLKKQNVFTPVFSAFFEIEIAEELTLLMSLLNVDLMEPLWRSEKDLIIAGESVREQQRERLARFYSVMTVEQLTTSFTLHGFWNLIKDQPKAAAAGFGISQLTTLVNYFGKNPGDNLIMFATGILPKLNENDDPDDVYNKLMLFAPLGKIEPTVKDTITLKRVSLTLALTRRYTPGVARSMVGVLLNAMN